MSYVAGQVHQEAKTRPASRYSGLRWAIIGCGAFWGAVAYGAVQALSR